MAGTARARPSAAPALAQLAAASLLGLVALPSALAQGPVDAPVLADRVRLPETVWLAAALVVAVWLLAVAPALARALAGLLARLNVRRGVLAGPAPPAAGAAESLARWLVAAGYVVLASAILRRPLVAVLGARLDPASVEAVFAAGALALLLLVLLWLHRSARPLVESAVWYALDALVATSGSEPSPGQTATIPAPAVQATRPAGALPDSAATRLASTAGDARREAAEPAATTSAEAVEATELAATAAEETREASDG